MKHKYKKGTETSLKTNFKELSNCAKDEFANVLIPPDVDLINPVAVKTLGNGNCLFNSASMFLRGVEDAHALLRLLTSIELHRNAAIYAYHDALSDSANSMRSEKSIFPDMITSDLAQRERYKSKDRVKSIKAEAIALSEDRVCQYDSNNGTEHSYETTNFLFVSRYPVQ